MLKAYFILLFMVSLFALVETAQGSDFRVYSLATGTSKGSYYPSGVAISTLVNMGYSEEVFDRFYFKVVKTQGSLENVQLLLRGKVDFAIVQGIVGYYMVGGRFLQELEGEEVFQELKEALDSRLFEVRSVMSLWSTVEHFLVSKSLRRGVGIGDFSDLYQDDSNLKRLGLGKEGSLGWISRYFLLGRLGLTNRADFVLNSNSFAESVNDFREGKLDLIYLSSGVPNLELSRLLLEKEFELLNFRGLDILTLEDLSVWLRPYTIGSGVYGDNERVTTIAQNNVLLARSDVSSRDVYLLTKLLFENSDYLNKIHDAFEIESKSDLLNGVVIPLHEGSHRYYEELGIETTSRLR